MKDTLRRIVGMKPVSTSMQRTVEEQILAELQRSNRYSMAMHQDIRALRRLVYNMIAPHARAENLPPERDDV